MEYLFAFQFWCNELYVENWWGGGRRYCFLNFCFLVMLLVSVGEGWWSGEKSYLGPAEKAPFSSQNFSRSNKHDTFGHVVSTRYFYILFLWTIAVSDFHPLEIYKNFSLPLSTITFTTNRHADNYFYKYICFNYTVWNQFFLLKYTLRFFTAPIFF